MPGPDELLAVRKKIEREAKRFSTICKATALTRRFGAMQGDSAARVPKGFAPDSPAGEFLKRKQLYYFTELDAKLALSPKLLPEVMAYFKPMLPFVQFINDAILAEMGDEQRPMRPEPMF